MKQEYIWSLIILSLLISLNYATVISNFKFSNIRANEWSSSPRILSWSYIEQINGTTSIVANFYDRTTSSSLKQVKVSLNGSWIIRGINIRQADGIALEQKSSNTWKIYILNLQQFDINYIGDITSLALSNTITNNTFLWLGRQCQFFILQNKIYRLSGGTYTQTNTSNLFYTYFDPTMNYFIADRQLYKYDVSQNSYIKVSNQTFYEYSMIFSYQNRIVINSSSVQQSYLSPRTSKIIIGKVINFNLYIIQKNQENGSIYDSTVTVSKTLEIVQYCFQIVSTWSRVVTLRVDYQRLNIQTLTLPQNNLFNNVDGINRPYRYLRQGEGIYHPNTINGLNLQQYYYKITESAVNIIGFKPIDSSKANQYVRTIYDLRNGSMYTLTEYRNVTTVQNITQVSVRIQQDLLILQTAQIPSFTSQPKRFNTLNVASQTVFSPNYDMKWIYLSLDNNNTIATAYWYHPDSSINLEYATLIFNGSWMTFQGNDIGYDCGIFKEKDQSNYAIVKLDAQTKTLTRMADISNIISDNNISQSTRWKVGKLCQSFAINSNVYRWNAGGSSYIKVNDPAFPLTAFDQTLNYAFGNSQIYKYASASNSYVQISNLSLFPYVQILSFDNHLVILTHNLYSPNSNSSAKGIIAIEINNSLNLIEVISYSGLVWQPSLYYSKKLTKLSFVFIIQNGSISQVRNVDYSLRYSYKINTPSLNFQGVQNVFVHLTDNFVLIHPTSADNSKSFKQLHYKFINQTQMVLINSKDINNNYNKTWKKSLISQRDNKLFIMTQYRIPYKWNDISVIISEQEVLPRNQSYPRFNFNRFLSFNTTNIISEQVYSPAQGLKWIYLTQDNNGTLTNVIGYWFNPQSNTTLETVSLTLNGSWMTFQGNDIGYDCGIFKEKDQSNYAIVKLDAQTKTLTRMADISNIISDNNISQSTRWKVGKLCQSFAINSNVYRWNAGGSSYIKVNDPAFPLTAFDQTLNYAFGNSQIYKYASASNSYVQISNLNLLYTGQLYSFNNRLVVITDDVASSYPSNSKIIIAVQNSNSLTVIETISYSGLIWKPQLYFSKQLTKLSFAFSFQNGTTKTQARTVNYYNLNSNQLNIPSRITQFPGAQNVYVFLTDKFVLLHPIPQAGVANLSQLYYQFDGSQMKFLGENNILADYKQYWKKAIIFEKSGQMYIISVYNLPLSSFASQYQIFLVASYIGSVVVPLGSNTNVTYGGVRSGVLDVNGSITLCSPGCSQCSDANTCTKCGSGYLLDSSNKCSRCSPQCKSCQANNMSLCLSCFRGFYESNGHCLSCSSSCIECGQSSATYCTACKPGFVAISGTCTQCSKNCISCNINKMCVQCKPGYATYNGKCRQCLASCSICQNQMISNCYACTKGYEFVSGLCKKCPSKCNTCSNQICSQCSSGFYLNSGVCVKQCSYPCLTCVANEPNKCLSCFAGYTLNSTSQECLANLSCNSTSSCIACPLKYALIQSNCFTCTTGQHCRRCSQNSVSICLQCQDGYYVDNGECQKCSQNCPTCLNNQTCTSCIDGYILKEQSCLKCSGKCLTCQNSQQNCKTCKEGYRLVGWKCIANNGVTFNITLNANLTALFVVYEEIRAAILVILKSNESQIITFYTINQGSVLLSGTLTPTEVNLASISQTLSTSLAQGGSLAGFQVISSTFSVEIPQALPQSSPKEQSSNNTKIIIIAVVVSVGSLLIIGSIIGICIYLKKKNKQQIQVIDLSQEIQIKQNKSQGIFISFENGQKNYQKIHQQV